MRSIVKIAAGALAGLLAAAPGLAAGQPVIAGSPETVFDWAAARCETWDIPDTPARAWRTPSGRVRLVAGSERSRIAEGLSLATLRHGCRVAYEGAERDDPAAYDDRAWIAATWAEGTRVIALAHVEYHGHLRPGRCPAGDYMACWRNAILELVSEDGGQSFTRRGLVAALPYPYPEGAGKRAGYFSPSNIFRRGDYLYVFVFAEATGAQKRGACLLRRPVGGGPGDWRAWDGAGFTRAFADPYRQAISDPGAHVCEPVPGIRSTISSVVEDGRSGRFLAVTPATLEDGDGVRQSGIWWTQSANLIDWARPRLLLAVPLLWRRDCGAEAAYAYPSFLDGDGPSANLDVVEGGFWLYLVRMPLGEDCSVGPERDLLRYPVSLPDGWDRP